MPLTDEDRERRDRRRIADYRHNLMEPGQYVPDQYRDANAPSDQTNIRWRGQATNYIDRQKAGWGSPICNLIVLDMIINTQTPTTIRSQRMSGLLNDLRGEYLWHSMTLGRILAQIFDCVIDNIPPNDESMRKGRDWKGGYFLYDPSRDAMEVLWQMREWIGPQCAPYRREVDAIKPLFVWMDFEYNPENPSL